MIIVQCDFLFGTLMLTLVCLFILQIRLYWRLHFVFFFKFGL